MSNSETRPGDPPLNELARALQARLELDAGLGVGYMPGIDWVPAPSRKTGPTVSPVTQPPSRLSPPRKRADDPPPAMRSSNFASRSMVPPVEVVPSPEKENALAALKEEAMQCGKCRLCERRNNVVWGEGSLDAEIMFIGEGPGQDEDASGRPFVGRAGKVLSDIIEKGMRQPRGSVYIANVVKCRPPGNRAPQSDEVAACHPYLRRQIETIRPKCIVSLGKVAGNFLTGNNGRMADLRGRWFTCLDIPLRATYHPSYLLRSRLNLPPGARSDADKETWEDIKTVLSRLKQR